MLLLEELAWMFWRQERGFGLNLLDRKGIVRKLLPMASSVDSCH
jgi:hypothetical protein